MKFTWRSVVALVVLLCAVGALLALRTVLAKPAGPQFAPEADAVLQSQAAMPFQVLIPAFLPARFDRRTVAVRNDLQTLDGAPMFELIYTDRAGGQLVLHEWALPATPTPAAAVSFQPTPAPATALSAGTQACRCGCPRCGAAVTAGAAAASDAPNPFQVDRDRLRVLAGVSANDVVDHFELALILGALAPPAGLHIYSTADALPLSETVPPAVPVELNAAGVQELVLVVSPEGYSPPHFAVARGVPVKITFRMVGNVGCGNELAVERGNGQISTAVLSNVSDAAVLEFTPETAGEFSFHCPHYIYRGVMTVTD